MPLKRRRRSRKTLVKKSRRKTRKSKRTKRKTKRTKMTKKRRRTKRRRRRKRRKGGCGEPGNPCKEITSRAYTTTADHKEEEASQKQYEEGKSPYGKPGTVDTGSSETGPQKEEKTETVGEVLDSMVEMKKQAEAQAGRHHKIILEQKAAAKKKLEARLAARKEAK